MKDDCISLSVVIPTYNEAENITRLIEELQAVIRAEFTPLFLEFIVVDDDSPDGTWKIPTKLSDLSVAVIRRLDFHGLRESLSEGIEWAHGDVVLWLDADFSHPPRYVPQLISAVYDGFDIAVNSRYVAGGEDVRDGKGTWLQRILSGTLNMTLRVILGYQFRDYTSGFCAARTRVVRELGLRGDYGEYFMDFIYRATEAGKRIAELPFRNEPRASGESKTGNTLRDYLRRGYRYLTMAVKVRCTND